MYLKRKELYMKKIKPIICLLTVLLIAVAFSVAAAATDDATVAYRYTANGETVEAAHVDGTMDLSHVVSLADAGTTVYVLTDIEMANGQTSESVLIDVRKNLTIDLGGNTLTIKQNGKNYIRTYHNVTATWQNGTIITARMDADSAGEAHPIFRFPDRTSPTLNLININSYTGGLIGSYSGQSITVNIEGGEHHMVLESDLHFNSIFHARAGTNITAKNASFYVGDYKLITAMSNKTTDGNYNHSYSFTNCNIIASSADTQLFGESNECVTASFDNCRIVGSISPTLHTWDSDAGRGAMKNGAITLGKGTVLANGSTISGALAACEDGCALTAINTDRDFTLNYASGTVYENTFTTKSSTKSFSFSSEVAESDGVSKTSETLIDSSTEWKYLDDNTDPAANLTSLTAWTLPSFDDSAWKTGIGSFGAKSGVLAAINSSYTPNVLLAQYQADGTTNIPTYFFRTVINIDDASEVSYVRLHAYADDGIIVYINGTAVLNTCQQTSTTTNLYYTGGVWDNTLTITSSELLDALVDGENTVAVELHNGTNVSSDIYFGMDELTVYYGEENPVPATQVILGVGSDETERAVSWLSTSSITGEVRLALASAVEGDTFPAEYESFESVSTAATNKVGYFAHDAVLTGLKENTAYAYQIVMLNGTSKIFYFNTGSFGDYSFIFVGDPQIESEAQGEAWADTLDKLIDEFDSEVIISAGDQIVTPSSEEHYTYFVKDALSSIAFAPSVGPVHDDPSASFADHFYTPNASASYGVTVSASNYWYVYNNTLFMHLNMADTSAASNGEHESFMKDAMAQNPDVCWNIVVMHVSLFSTGMHGNPEYKYYASEVEKYRAELIPVFEELGIDAVLSGHDHIYLRTKMMEGEQVSDDTATDSFAINPNGTLYLCANSSTGSKFYSKTYEPTFAACENYEYRKSAVYFKVTDTTLTMTSYFLDDMSVFDTFTIYKVEEEKVDTEIGHSCTFNNDLSLNTYVPSASLADYTGVYLNIEHQTYIDGALTTEKTIIENYAEVDGNLKFIYSGIAACEMGDKIYITLYAVKDGKMYATETIEYSVMTYAYNMLEKSADEAFKTLLVDMLNYGAAAQLYFEYDTENLVNANLTEAQKELATDGSFTPESISRVVTDLDSETASIIGQSVVFNSNVELKYYVRLASGADASGYSLKLTYTTVGGVNKEIEIGGEDFVYIEAYDAYGVKYTGIAAPDMSCEILATVYSSDTTVSDTVAYSIESYVANMLEKSEDEVFKALITELYKYSVSSKTYFE